jgi:hypothetical protein
MRTSRPPQDHRSWFRWELPNRDKGELGLDTHWHRRWRRRVSYFIKSETCGRYVICFNAYFFCFLTSLVLQFQATVRQATTTAPSRPGLFLRRCLGMDMGLGAPVTFFFIHIVYTNPVFQHLQSSVPAALVLRQLCTILGRCTSTCLHTHAPPPHAPHGIR